MYHVDENDYQYDDDKWTNPLSESNLIYQTNKHFMKYVNFTLQEMTPEQMKQNPIKVHPNQKLDIEEGESNTDEQESTISNKDEEEFTTSQELPEEYSTSDIPTKCTEESKYIEIPQEVHTILVKSTHDEIDSSHDKYVTEFETSQVNEEEIVVQENKQVLPIFNKTTSDEDDSSEDQNMIEIEPIVCIAFKNDEDDSIEDQPTTEIEPYTESREQDIVKEENLLTTNFQMEIENRKVEGLITYSTDQQIFKIIVNSGTNQEVC